MSDWVRRTQTIEVGDRVGYSRHFLRSISCYTGDMPLARGTVMALVKRSDEVTLAEIAWDKPDLPGRVNVKSLSTVKSIALGE